MNFDWTPRSGKVALVRWNREWRVCFVETPDKHLTFMGVYFYGGKTLKEATADAERMADKNDFEFVGRLDKLALAEDA